MSQRERRQNPYPWTWEPAVLVITVFALAALVGLQAGRFLANGVAAGNWQIAHANAWVTTVADLLAGDAVAGLDPAPELVASPTVLWVVTGLVELVLLAGTACGVRWGWRRWNPWRPRGFADPADINRILGLSRLRRTAHLIRPDLLQAARETTRQPTTATRQHLRRAPQ